jgi:mono/diheme cytochrome c family protein
VRAEDVLDFGKLYGQHCAGCHGVDGKLGPAPPLNDPLFLDIVSDAGLRQVINGGRPGAILHAFGREQGGSLTSAQVDALIYGMRARWNTRVQPTKEVLPAYRASDSEGTPAGDAQAGAKVFAVACASCHGSDGRGGAQAGAVNNPAFLALISDQALRRIVITGRADLGMPDYRTPEGRPSQFKPLEAGDIADVVALLASWRRTNSASAAVERANRGSPTAAKSPVDRNQ